MARSEIVVHAPPERVFAVLSDPRAYGDWVPGARGIRAADERWPEPGTAFDHSVGVSLLSLDDHTEVAAVLAPVRLALVAHARPLGTARVVLELQPDGPGTKVMMVEDPAPWWLSLAIGPAGHELLRLRNREALRRLKGLAERTRSSPQEPLPRRRDAAEREPASR